MLKLGNQGVAAMYLGGRKITKAYLGEALVFGASAPPEPVRYTVTLSVDPQGGGTASGGGSVEAGAQVTVTASASSGYTFSGWRENGGIVSTSASYTFTVTGDRSLTAVFAAVIPTYRVTAGIDPEGSGTASGAGTYQQGTSVTVTAAPGEGYRFVKWTENGQTVSESQSYTFTVTGDRTLTAVFEAEKTSRLPAGYTEVEWIQPSTNTSKLDTKAYIGTTSILTMDAELVSPIVTKGYNYVICGIQIAGGKATLQQILVASTGIRAAFFSNNATSGPPGVLITSNLNPRNITFSVDVASKTVSVNSEKTSELSSFSGGPINIGGNGTVSFLTQTGMRIKRFKVERTASTTASYNKELIPCKNANGTIGMFDIVNNVFLTATGTWTAGPAV